MRKRLLTSEDQNRSPQADKNWLDLEHLAKVEITSEDPSYPIESALLPGESAGWRAAGPGKQTIRLLFDTPQAIRTIRLCFVEAAVQRTQEYVLRWSPDGGLSFQELVRQQWNFNPGSASTESEEHCVELSGVSTLELIIIPDLSGGNTVATLAQFRIA